MLISSKGRYAIRVILDLAEHSDGQFIPLKDIAARQDISQKYMESIMTLLSKNGFVEAMHGKGGGYCLNKPASEYKIGDILRLTEGTLAPVTCLQEETQACERAAQCKTLPLWMGLDKVICDYLDNISIADIMKENRKVIVEKKENK